MASRKARERIRRERMAVIEKPKKRKAKPKKKDDVK